jgi:subtilisin family serine protease
MMRFTHLLPVVLAALVGFTACSDPLSVEPLGPELDAVSAKRTQYRPIAINVGLNTPATDAIRTELSRYGTVADELPQLNVVFMVGRSDDIPAIEALPFVAFAEPDTEMTTGPLDAELPSDFSVGLSTWNLDAINVRQPGIGGPAVAETGAGVYVGVLDTGLMKTWRLYFPEERIAEEYAVAFSGGWHPKTAVPTTPNVWENDVNGHGTHVTSTILGYDFYGTPVAGVAPNATVIPVKVLGQSGTGWTSMVAAGLVHVADLAENELAGSRIVINMSLSGGPSALRDWAVDYAMNRGVVVVAAAGNYGSNGMGYPGATAPAISVASAGWIYQGATSNWWYGLDLPESGEQYFISGFSSRPLPGQDLDVAAPGNAVVGPYQINSGAHVSYYFLSGTSMASPHVAGIVALMLEKDPSLGAGDVEAILEGAADPSVFYGPAGPWGPADYGHGFITADAALAAVGAAP